MPFYARKPLEKELNMSKEILVKFTLPKRYFADTNKHDPNNMSYTTCQGVLVKAFNLPHRDSHALLKNAGQNGVEITCTPTQFSAFIIHRHTYGKCINGIRDLNPEFIEKQDEYDRIAMCVGTTRDNVKRVLLAAGYDNGRFREMAPSPAKIDVSAL